jgi:DNA polymerase III epsilon subunit-like protein
VETWTRGVKKVMRITFFDTETTGLLLPEGAPLGNQPYIIEFAAITTNSDLEEIERLDFLCKPPVPIPEKITKITGISGDDLRDELPFSDYSQKVIGTIYRSDIVIAHNVSFDCGMVSNEMERIGIKVIWPRKIDTVEATFHINNKRMNLGNCYEHFLGEKPPQAHRAIADVESLIKLTRELKKKGLVEW